MRLLQLAFARALKACQQTEKTQIAGIIM